MEEAIMDGDSIDFLCDPVDLVGYQSIFKRLRDGGCTSEIPQARN
jgi:hypothetical protein